MFRKPGTGWFYVWLFILLSLFHITLPSTGKIDKICFASRSSSEMSKSGRGHLSIGEWGVGASELSSTPFSSMCIVDLILENQVRYWWKVSSRFDSGCGCCKSNLNVYYRSSSIDLGLELELDNHTVSWSCIYIFLDLSYSLLFIYTLKNLK